MNFLAPFLFAVLFGYASAAVGIVNRVISEAEATQGGYKKALGGAPQEILSIPDRGSLMLELARYQNGKDTMQNRAPSRYYIRVFWRDTNTQIYNLDLVEINWPSGTPTIEMAKSSFVLVTRNNYNDKIRVTYLRKIHHITRTFAWNETSKRYEVSKEF